MNNQILWLSKLEAISRAAKGSHFHRLVFRPYHYIVGILFSKVIFPFYQKSWVLKRKTFFGTIMTVALPAGLDIFILGAKGHDSEIRLAKFMLRHLNKKNIFFDVGAHFGYFSLLASRLVGEEGRVVGFEASKRTFPYYEKNVKDIPNILSNHKAVEQMEGKVIFYEFPILYSEYNSLEKEQYSQEGWAKSAGVTEISVDSTSLDIFYKKTGIIPDMIKIDVEGGEYLVLTGAVELLDNCKPTVIMEFIPPRSPNWEENPHYKALQCIRQRGYEGYLIDNEGNIQKTELAIHLLKKMISENIVFIHPEKTNESGRL